MNPLGSSAVQFPAGLIAFQVVVEDINQQVHSVSKKQAYCSEPTRNRVKSSEPCIGITRSKNRITEVLWDDKMGKRVNTPDRRSMEEIKVFEKREQVQVSSSKRTGISLIRSVAVTELDHDVRDNWIPDTQMRHLNWFAELEKLAFSTDNNGKRDGTPFEVGKKVHMIVDLAEN
ncbi:hypothetical protein CLF_101198 [Clonorchis sinensis]|uniref:Uncharacterized protein n=1 Tax=Clonorchis sinensis TaxID=79923 RepID=G7Y582_CLOSI|nr:hypothetical protein CLF_101198 [Clonorchis sinensis]